MHGPIIHFYNVDFYSDDYRCPRSFYSWLKGKFGFEAGQSEFLQPTESESDDTVVFNVILQTQLPSSPIHPRLQSLLSEYPIYFCPFVTLS